LNDLRLEHLQILYINSFRTATHSLLPPSEDNREGFGKVLRQLFALRNLDELFELTRSKREERRLAAIIKRATKSFANTEVQVKQLTRRCRDSDCIALLVQNGWRIRKLPGTNRCVVESN
jgi:hypothetical protein